MFRLWAVLVILIAVNEKIVQGLFADCYLEDGRAGTCMELERCVVSLTAYHRCGVRPEKCDTGIQKAQVCCPNNPMIIEERPIDYSCSTYNYGRRVIGIRVENRTRYPHMAALGYIDPYIKPYAWRCGGTLIHIRYVLTAAHCLESPGPKAVLLGAYDLKYENDQHRQLIKVQSFFKYKGYQKRGANRYKDIGLVYLRRAIIDTPYVSPACLLTTEIQNYDVLSTIGWGGGSEDEDENTGQKFLRKATLYLTKCEQRQEIKNNQYLVCTGNTNNTACAGDSGGPLQVYQDKRLYVMGVYSFGPTICSSRGYARFVRLTHFLDWIEKKVWSAEHCMFKEQLPQ